LKVFTMPVIISTVGFRSLSHQGLKSSPLSYVMETIWSTTSHAHFYLMGFKTLSGVFNFHCVPSIPQLNLVPWES
jgi:hypothetical protein